MSQTVTSSPFSHVSYTYKHTYFFTVSWQIMYLHLFEHTNILHIFPTIHHVQILSLSLSQTYCPDHKQYHLLHTPVHILTYSHTHVYLHVFLHKGSMQKYATKITQVPLPRLFILDDLLYIHKTLPHHIKKTTFKNFTYLTHRLFPLSLYMYLDK